MCMDDDNPCCKSSDNENRKDSTGSLTTTQTSKVVTCCSTACKKRFGVPAGTPVGSVVQCPACSTLQKTESSGQTIPYDINSASDTMSRNPLYGSNKPVPASELPEGWDVRDDGRGGFYYADNVKMETSWTPPKHALPVVLPEGWERRKAADGRVYYADNVNKKTSWAVPAGSTRGVDHDKGEGEGQKSRSKSVSGPVLIGANAPSISPIIDHGTHVHL
jgi:hypothetical protein